MANGDLINKKHVKDFAVKFAQRNRTGWKPERVSQKFLDDVNAMLRHRIEVAILKHPTVGKTIKYLF